MVTLDKQNREHHRSLMTHVHASYQGIISYDWRYPFMTLNNYRVIVTNRHLTIIEMPLFTMSFQLNTLIAKEL